MRRGDRIAQVAVLLVVGGAAAVLGYFSVHNADLYWSANHPPHAARLVPALVTDVGKTRVCHRTVRGLSGCSTLDDGLAIRLGDGTTQLVEARADHARGDRVTAFRDGGGDWQVRGAFTAGWAARAVGLTGLAALGLLVVTYRLARPGRPAA